MTVVTDHIAVETRGRGHAVDVTEKAAEVVRRSGLRAGVLTLFCPGSTGGLTTIEYEPGVVGDLEEALERVAPRDGEYRHHAAWGDDNGHSHVRAALVGPSLGVPFVEATLTLGTWQQIVFLDFDTRARSRRLVAQLVGEQ